MTLGNLIAIVQTNIKRMLAFSSIAHAGYLLVALLAAGNSATSGDAGAGLLFYLTAYYLMNIGAFAVAILVHRAHNGSDYAIDSYHGLAGKNRWLAAAMAFFLISLAGIPPTAGFIGKLTVFTAAVKAGYTGLVVIAVLNSVVSVYYYLRIVVYMYMKPATSPDRAKVTPAYAVVIALAVAGILLFGVMPGSIMEWAGQGASQLISNNSFVSVAQVVSTLGH